MRHELYVRWLVVVSDRARAVVGEQLATFALSDLLRALPSLGENWHAETAARIRAAFSPPSLPSMFTEQHLRALVDVPARGRLADVFGCTKDEVVAVLFDIQPLARALRETGGEQSGSDAEGVFLKLLGRLPRLRARHNLNAQDWGSYLEQSGWLTLTAVDRLAEAASLWGWSETSPTRILAGVLAG